MGGGAMVGGRRVDWEGAKSSGSGNSKNILLWTRPDSCPIRPSIPHSRGPEAPRPPGFASDSPTSYFDEEESQKKKEGWQGPCAQARWGWPPSRQRKPRSVHEVRH